MIWTRRDVKVVVFEALEILLDFWARWPRREKPSLMEVLREWRDKP